VMLASFHLPSQPDRSAQRTLNPKLTDCPVRMALAWNGH
jgi:hypothetical protein